MKICVQARGRLFAQYAVCARKNPDTVNGPLDRPRIRGLVESGAPVPLQP